MVFVRAGDFDLEGCELPSAIEAKPRLMERLEMVRAMVAVGLGLASDPESARTRSAAHRKIALIAAARDYLTTSGDRVSAGECDVLIRMLSMGRAHQSVPLTGAMCAAVAAAIEGSLLNETLGLVEVGRPVRLGHAAGTLDVGARVYLGDDLWQVESVSVTRTARALLEGHLLVPVEWGLGGSDAMD